MALNTQTQADLIAKLFGRGTQPKADLPRESVTTDSIDRMEYRMRRDDSPRFRRHAVEDAPRIAPDVQDPDPIDFTQATPDEIKAWQEQAREAKALRDAVQPYDAWQDLTRDVFASYHHSKEPEALDPDAVDPAVAHHAKIMARMMAEDAHAEARNVTREKPTAAALATMAAVNVLKDALEDELAAQAEQSQKFEDARNAAEQANDAAEYLKDQARDLMEDGQPLPPELVQQIKTAVQAKREAQAQAAQVAAGTPVPMDRAGADAVQRAVQAGAAAAGDAANLPSFAQGFGKGEPRYESPEQALSIADAWLNNPILRKVAELYGRLDREMRFTRARRTIGGADEIVDLKFGDDIRRILPSELGALADEDLEDDFFMRWLASEVLVYDTVGDENAGKGPIVLCCDESYSMNGDRNVWSKALALCLLNIARREKRDFAYIAWADGDTSEHLFVGRDEMDPEAIVHMCSHFFGGGTNPLSGLVRAERIMERREFKKADIVLVSDGEAGFGQPDRELRDKLLGRGVRLWGVGVGREIREGRGYLHEWCEDVVHINDFELDNPSAATAHLATHIT